MPKAVKIQILMGILMDNAQPYTLKEMEKLGSKQKVVSQSIKDVLQELVDERWQQGLKSDVSGIPEIPPWN